MRAIIKVGYRCNQRCVFCHRLGLREPDGGAECDDREVRARIERAHALGHTMVVLSGGEPTIRRELRGWASRIAALGMGLGLITNGQMLAYPEVVEDLIGRGLRYVHLSLHGGSAAVHDRLIGGPGFAHAVTALGNLDGRGIEVVVNAVVTRHNVDQLNQLVDLMRDHPDAVLKFSLVEPRGGGRRHFDELTPSVAAAGAAVARALAADPARAARRGFAHDGIPFCLLPGWEDLYSDLETADFAAMIEVGDRDFFAIDDRARTKPESCQECRWRGGCPGLYLGYLERRGAAELVPVLGGRRSNSFHYVRVGRLPERVVESCPLRRDGVSPWSSERDLLIRDADRLIRYRTATRDFASDEIAQIKHQRGQLYLDRSNKPAPDDFAADLIKLTRSQLCQDCPEQSVCTGIFELADDSPFTRDESEIRQLIAGAAGRILDVGCGHGRYLDLLEPLATAGVISYVGVDPDRDRLVDLAARWPEAVLHPIPAEEMTTAQLGSRFDYILLLRSWNHLTDLGQTLEAVAGLLRPGGQLLVVDDVPFGLARSPQQAIAGEAGPAIFEHHRNHDAARAHHEIDIRLGPPAGDLRLVRRRDVTPATSNQWLLLYRRASGPA